MRSFEAGDNSRLYAYRKCLYVVLVLGVAVTVFSIYYTFWMKIPSTITVKAGVDQTLDFGLPASGTLYKEAVEASSQNAKGQKAVESTGIPVDFSSPVTVKADRIDTYKLELKLFGVIPFKDVDVEVIQDVQLKPVGIPIGIYVKTECTAGR